MISIVTVNSHRFSSLQSISIVRENPSPIHFLINANLKLFNTFSNAQITNVRGVKLSISMKAQDKRRRKRKGIWKGKERKRKDKRKREYFIRNIHRQPLLSLTSTSKRAYHPVHTCTPFIQRSSHVFLLRKDYKLRSWLVKINGNFAILLS